MESGLFYSYQVGESICQVRGAWFSFVCHYFFLRRNTRLPYANKIDSDQTTHLMASDMGLHCLHMSNLLDLSR